MNFYSNQEDHMTRLTSNCLLTKYTWNEQAPIKRNACMTDHHFTRENVDSAAAKWGKEEIRYHL